MADPVTGVTGAAVVIAGLKYVGQPTAELVKDFVGRILGPSADSLGQSLKEWIEQRNDRGADTLIEAGTLLHDAGIDPQAVPGRILFPLVQNASLQDQPELRRKYAALLANAATPGFQEILPAYIDILGQLTPVHVLLLDWMESVALNTVFEVAAGGQVLGSKDHFHPIPKYAALDKSGLTEPQYRIVMADLHRMRLIDSERTVMTLGDEYGTAEPTDYMNIYLTPLGFAFIDACRPPE